MFSVKILQRLSAGCGLVFKPVEKSSGFCYLACFKKGSVPLDLVFFILTNQNIASFTGCDAPVSCLGGKQSGRYLFVGGAPFVDGVYDFLIIDRATAFPQFGAFHRGEPLAGVKVRDGGVRHQIRKSLGI